MHRPHIESHSRSTRRTQPLGKAQDFPHERKWPPILILIDDSLRAVAEWSETARNDEIVLVNSFDVRGERIYKSSIVLCSDRSSSNELRT